ncbi:MAG: hypothetical protein HDQ98_12435 [Lachnospiraceae bacterium]|nr:hypothetical protein [Lachnospiraceae bacterium]
MGKNKRKKRTERLSVPDRKSKTTNNKVKQAGKWIIIHIYNILYLVMLSVLWVYIIINWEICISMQFFSRFDGNNILFLVGILLVILPFYELEGKGTRLRRTGTKAMEEDYRAADSRFLEDKIKNQIKNQMNKENLQQETKSFGGEKK